MCRGLLVTLFVATDRRPDARQRSFEPTPPPRPKEHAAMAPLQLQNIDDMRSDLEEPGRRAVYAALP